MFALLIGIDNYPQIPLAGAVRDVESVHTYLVKRRVLSDQSLPHLLSILNSSKVMSPDAKEPFMAVDAMAPLVSNEAALVADEQLKQLAMTIDNKIKILKNEQATRASIIAAFKTHLIENIAIQRGDPILFYYAGHGTSQKRPAGWPGPVMHAEPTIESIVPYDSMIVSNGSDDAKVASCIPDRTINALLRRLARAKGDNITVIFDSCHAESSTRNGEDDDEDMDSTGVNRGIDPNDVGPLVPDTDADIWSMEKEEVWDSFDKLLPAGYGSRGLATSDTLHEGSHVLLAACERNQEAREYDGRGVFTFHLLKVLSECGENLTNQEVCLVIEPIRIL
jgi:hypothetical protein